LADATEQANRIEETVATAPVRSFIPVLPLSYGDE
jgi:hypothetical protein